MSRWYGMAVRITGFPSTAVDEIKYAAEAEWPFEDWAGDGQADELTSYAEEDLGGGELEAEFTERLALAIWRAAGAYCEVTVDATYLEDLPCETHSLDEDDYTRLIVGRADALSTGDTRDEEESP
jgi:hypothetical protein